MLTEERQAAILRILEERGAVTVTELTRLLETSESTVRRDLIQLDRMGKLNKVHGGATALSDGFSAEEAEVELRYTLHTEEKKQIASRAAELIRANDFVYIDAGTTTEQMAEYIKVHNAVYVTNGITLARKLSKLGFQTYILSGRVKAVTEAIIGTEAIDSLRRFHFSVGFFGTNGASLEEGYTTPDIDEASVKAEALSRCKRSYVLADPSKIGTVSSVSFGKLADAALVTTTLADRQYKNKTNVLEVEE